MIAGMNDEGSILQCILNRDVKGLCLRVCYLYVHKRSSVLSLFIKIYSIHYSHSTNLTFLNAIIQRLNVYGNSELDDSKVIVELYLLIYNGNMKCQDQYKAAKVHHIVSDLKILIMDDSNLSTCKNICFSYLKSGKQDKVRFSKMQQQYQQDFIWVVWNELMKITFDIGEDIHKYCRLQFDIFTLKYSRKAAKERINIVYNILDKISESLTTKFPYKFVQTPVIKLSFIEIMLKIDFIFQELSYKQTTCMKSFLNDCCLHCFPDGTDRIPRVEQNYIPESKSVSLLNHQKIEIEGFKKI